MLHTYISVSFCSGITELLRLEEIAGIQLVQHACKVWVISFLYPNQAGLYFALQGFDGNEAREHGKTI